MHPNVKPFTRVSVYKLKINNPYISAGRIAVSTRILIFIRFPRLLLFSHAERKAYSNKPLELHTYDKIQPDSRIISRSRSYLGNSRWDFSLSIYYSVWVLCTQTYMQRHICINNAFFYRYYNTSNIIMSRVCCSVVYLSLMLLNDTMYLHNTHSAYIHTAFYLEIIELF